MLEVKILFKKYDENNIIFTNVNFSLPDKGLFTILGRSGSGKTTLLNMIGGIDKPTSGEVISFGKNLGNLTDIELAHYRKKMVGFVFQSSNLIENISVANNILLNYNGKKLNSNKLHLILDKLGISSIKKRKAKYLSGGQKKRVAIARALINNSPIILADEPTGNLDENNSDNVWQILKNLSKNALVIVSTHDEAMAMEYSDGILAIKNSNIEITMLHNNYNSSYENMPLETLNLNIFKTSKLLFSSFNFKNIIISVIIFFLVEITLFSINLTKNNLSKSEAIAVAKNYKDTYMSLSKQNQLYSVSDFFTEEEIVELENYLNNQKVKYNINYIINNINSGFVQFAYGNIYKSIPPISKSYDIVNGGYYQRIDSLTVIDEQSFNLKYIGSFPKNSNEIMISNFMAETIIHYGIVYDDGSEFNPKTFEDIIDNLINAGDYTFKITGIYYLPYDLEKFKNKEIKYEIKNNTYMPIYDSELTSISEDSKIIYSSNKIIDYISSFERYRSDDDKFEYYLETFNENKLLNFISSPLIPTREEYLLNDNEVVVNKKILNYLTNNDFEKSLNEQTDLKEVEFAMKYMKENNIFNSKINIIIKEKYDSKNTAVFPLEVVGYVENDDNSNGFFYISRNVLQNYLERNYYADRVLIYENDAEKIEHLINNYDEDKNFSLNTNYTEDFNALYPTFESITHIAIIIFVGMVAIWGLFTFLVALFIIGLEKKKISILKMLGYDYKFLSKLYILNFIAITIIPLLLSIFSFRIVLNFVNRYLARYTGINSIFIFLNWYSIPILIVTYFVIFITTAILPIKSIAKLNPLDILRKKS